MGASDNNQQVLEWWTQRPITEFLSYLCYMEDFNNYMKKEMKKRQGMR